MDRSRGFRRLIKKTSGTVTTLWEDVVPYITGREYVLTVDCRGHRLTGYLDGMEVFSLDDAKSCGRPDRTLLLGERGCALPRGARRRTHLDSVLPFRDGDLLPAGTRVRVFAGNAAAAPPAEPHVVHG